MIEPFIAWMMQPLGGAAEHALPLALVWHGRLMLLSWGVVLPLGVLVARFFKVMPGQDWPRVLDNPRWWKLHLHGQTLGVGLALVGLSLVWGQAPQANTLARWHGLIGLGVMALGVIQIVAGWLRGSKGGPTGVQLRGDHYDMTPRRKSFERMHKTLGYLALLAAGVALALGLQVAGAPRWMLVGLVAWWLVVIGAFARLQRQGRCLDTYQAIWGPARHHPGNLVKPIGWGIRRRTPESDMSKEEISISSTRRR